ncbi:amine oxidase-like protein [Cucurbitaria berberidis CBS 394.84]|uniref:Amine oxidase-like protein n=1 Tax=Cucurbitaria berberidis CBS 394.84 TaxID=1168544 RepID=A0A9P4GVH6_9PLEO|nr:amine oxidase-like protein [Cucurbitaria berberidis CBS 394.84]KAF1852039.1 amine oxidase-like protein [Cucurbitaria berberidis CBS 394.84]
MERKRIAIVGSGISGLSTLWALRNTQYEIHLFEKEDRLGGHTNTVTWTRNGHNTPVDTGFIVLNTATYPNFISFLKALDVKTIASEMTFGISRDAGAFEWSGTSPQALFAQASNALKPSFWRMIFDIIRFNQFALDLLAFAPGSPDAIAANNMSIGKYLEREGYSDAFRDDYLIPMTACVWSTGADKCSLEFPALTLVRFMWNHHLLSTTSQRPPWLTVEGGSKRYIDAVMKECGNAHVHLGSPVEAVTPQNRRVELRIGGKGEGEKQVFDEVVLACHGDQARWIIGDAATSEEKDILDAFETTPNTAYLHSDLSLMPKRRTAWSAWNYLTTSSSSPSTNNPSGSLQTVCLTYNMNILQHIPTSTFSDVLVTLNPETPPSPSLTQATYQYRHPLYNSRMIAAQDQLERIQGKRGIWYTGAWTGYGFHEDGCKSGLQVGERLGGSLPWELVDAKYMRGLKPQLVWKDWVVRAVVWVLQLWITILERVVGIKRNRHADAPVNRMMNGKSKAV